MQENDAQPWFESAQYFNERLQARLADRLGRAQMDADAQAVHLEMAQGALAQGREGVAAVAGEVKVLREQLAAQGSDENGLREQLVASQKALTDQCAETARQRVATQAARTELGRLQALQTDRDLAAARRRAKRSAPLELTP